MAQPMDPMRLKGTMLDTRKVVVRNCEKTGKEQRVPEALRQGEAGTAGVEAMQVE